MMNAGIDLFLKATGVIGRRAFWIGFVGIAIFVFAGNAYLRTFPEPEISFWIALVFPFLTFYMIYCVYGKRLHDMGRTVWPLTSAIILEFIVVIGVMLAFGGAEYFAAFSEYERKAVIDETVRTQLITEYQNEISENMGLIRPLFLIIPVAFTLWVGMARKYIRRAA